MKARRYSKSLLTTFSMLIAAAIFSHPAAAAPVNDNFSAGTFITGSNNVLEGTNVDATPEVGEPLYNGSVKTVWYRWIAPANLSMTFQTTPNGTLNDTVLGVFVGNSVNTLSAVAAYSDDINGSNNRKSRITFIAYAGVMYHFQVSGFQTASGTFGLFWQVNQAESGKQFNFNGTYFLVQSHFAVFRPDTGFWYVAPTQGTPNGITAQWGAPGDAPVPVDYDGDSTTDIAVWRPGTGTYYILNSLTGTFTSLAWGSSDDQPVLGDFDGDDKGDPAVWRASSSTFYVRKSTDGGFIARQWGLPGDALACGDYDGDGKTDFGVVRSSGGNLGTFYILRSSDGSILATQFGLSTDLIYPGDFDRDGKNDIAVYRWNMAANFFYILNSSDGAFRAVQWGTGLDLPVPGNYGHDIQSDLCIWRRAIGTFYCSTDGGTGPILTRQWGITGDYPIAASNIH